MITSYLQKDLIIPFWLTSNKQKALSGISLNLFILLFLTLQHSCFPVNFAKFLRAPIFVEHMRTGAFVYEMKTNQFALIDSYGDFLCWRKAGQRQSSHISFKIGALQNFAKFTGRNLCWGIFFHKVVGMDGLNLKVSSSLALCSYGCFLMDVL